MNKIIKLESHQETQVLCGLRDENIKIIEKEFDVNLSIRGDDLRISGVTANVKKTSALVEYILSAVRSGQTDLGMMDLSGLINKFKKGSTSEKPAAQIAPSSFVELPSLNMARRLPNTRQIGPRTNGQTEYFEAIKKFDIVFGVGPAGTGKTYLAMACAVEALKKHEVRRIILTRPAIEAGESLGYLPGDMYEKISPYLRPLYDALYDMMEAERIEKYLETGIIEVAPLAYMRGRTLNDAFIILDEAQNCTAEQMKMFLTRLGFDSKVVITGDMTQSDLPDGKPIGLLQAQDILKDIEGIRFIYFTGSDVVRHALVQRIIEAYDKTVR
ncbi:MAG: PhoH family protein [Candidatus Omnitrophica bacterium]|nr:PhoH family protein [Candidatus Omnitrophota bacterium]